MRADATPAWSAWSAVGDNVKREVAECAARGKRHPDAQVAAAAAAWADIVIYYGDNAGADSRFDRLLERFGDLLLFFGFDPVSAAEQEERHWAFRVKNAR